MNPLLTPESICELDTFTLEEKIEELDSLHNKEFFSDIIRMAKLELIDRLSIQQFGRQLANDQYKIDFDLFVPPSLPKIKPSPVPQIFNNRKDFLMKMQSNIMPSVSIATVGRPAVNHRYKPKNKERDQIDRPKNFLKAKKYSYSKPKQKGLSTVKIKPSMPKVRQKLASQAIQMPIQTERIDINEKPNIQGKEQLTLKEKLKREVQQMKVEYRQNDAYDDMKTIKMNPLNLKEEQQKIHTNQGLQQSVQIVEYCEQQIYNNIESQRQKSTPEIESKQKLIEEKRNNNELKMEDLQTQQQYKQKTNDNELIQSTQVRNTSHSSQIQSYRSNSSLKTQIPSQNQFNASLNQNEPSLSFKNKDQKSKSVKHFNKKTYQNIKSDDHADILNIKLLEPSEIHIQDRLQTKLIKKEEKQLKFRKTGLDYRLTHHQKIVFPYHQIISSFSKLFPHSKSLLTTLRNVQENLKLHFEKNVVLKSLNDDRKVDTEDFTFKVVSECQKARQNRNLFNIEISSFYERGRMMLKRIKAQLRQPQPHEMLFYRVVRTKEEVYDIINSSFHRTSNWYELPHGLELKTSWNLLWTWSRPQIDFQDLFFFQKVNHFLGNKEIARKDLLKKSIQKIQKLSQKMRQYFDIIPETYLLPGENIQFIKKFRENGLKEQFNFWILKPVGLSRGRGISLINKLEDVVFSEPIVLQKYIMNPLLIEGFKFDMRIYVLVTSINPLQAFIYKEGFARMSTQLYSTDQSEMQNKFIHLTNFSIQRYNLSEEKKNLLEQNIGGSKISLRMLSEKLKFLNVDWSIIEKQIQDIVLKSLIASMNSIPPNPNCFQLFGYDIFIDSTLKCWLLEINSSPSLEKQYTLDQIIKQQLVDDIVQIVSPLNYDRSRLLQVVQRRRKEAEGLKSSINTHSNSNQQLNEDLDYILHGQQMRRYGEKVQNNNFKMVAPSQHYYKIIKVLQHYKIDPIIKQL